MKESIKTPHHWPLCGEFTSDRWISHFPNASIWWPHHDHGFDVRYVTTTMRNIINNKCFHLMTSSCYGGGGGGLRSVALSVFCVMLCIYLMICPLAAQQNSLNVLNTMVMLWNYIGQVTELRLFCYLVLLFIASKTRWQDSRSFVTWPIWYTYWCRVLLGEKYIFYNYFIW